MLRKILIGAVAVTAALVLGVVAWVAVSVQGLPDYKSLTEYKPPVTSRVHAGDGALIAEFAREHRIFVPIESIPDNVKNAFLSAEDKGFYEHSGLDYSGIARATLTNVASIFTGDRMQGASTITQQVAKNMLLTSDRTVSRKVKEAFLAQRIEKALDKDRILELYLNEIYLGQRAYGVAAAALNYFDKPISELTLAEAAYLGALPKAPNNYHPIKQKERAVARRNWVIDRMVDNGFATAEQGAAAKAEDLVSRDRLEGETYVASAHFVEELRRETLAMFERQAAQDQDGKRQSAEQMLYDGGVSIRSTLDTRLQVAAAAALRRGLDQFDRRKGWRGPITRVDGGADPAKALEKVDPPPAATGWVPALVTAAAAKAVTIKLADGTEGQLANEDVAWAAQGARREKNRALAPGAVVYVQPLKSGRFGLRQPPEIEGAIVAMDANTGRILAMVGGYSFAESQYNRATQAKRQPGSAFKPFVYAAALEYGLTPATLIMDEPFQMQAGDGTLWSPENYTKEFYGPTTLRAGLEKSRNAMTVRLAYEMGMERVSAIGKRFGVYDELPPLLAMSLGSGETTLLRLVRGYASFVNGGKLVEPTLIDRIQDRDGKTIFRHDQRPCAGCLVEWANGSPPVLPDPRLSVFVDPQTNAPDPIIPYQIVSMLEGAVTRGTGTVIKGVGKPLAGKTGTTNDYKDAWFIGFSPDLVVGIWAGYDKPRSLGEGETGGRLAAPIFGDFMKEALKETPATPFRRPAGLRLVRIDAKTGLLPGAETVDFLEESFRPGTEPVRDLAATPFVYGEDFKPDQSLVAGLEDAFRGTDEVGAPAPTSVSATPGAPAQPGPAAAPPAPAPRVDEPLGGIY